MIWIHVSKLCRRDTRLLRRGATLQASIATPCLANQIMMYIYGGTVNSPED